MDIRLKGIEPGEVRHFLEVTETSFGAALPDEVFESFQAVLETDRATGAFDGDDLVGTTAAYSLSLTVPGGEAPCAGVTMVGVVPTHRRRGVMSALMTHQLREVAERGEPLAALWASEDAIYGRFGYGAASLQALIDVPRHRTRLLDESPIEGRLRLVDRDEALTTFPSVYERVRVERPGAFKRSEKWWRHRTLRNPTSQEHDPFFRALLEHEGEPAAYAVYQVHQQWDRGIAGGHVQLREVMAATPRGHRDIWKFLFGIDLVESVKSSAFFLPSDDPLLLLLAEPRYLGFLSSNGLWLRIVDLPAALEARGYEGSGAITIEVHDPLLETNSAVWRVEVSEGRVRVDRTGGDADIRLGIAELGALYLGQFTFAQMAAAGRLEGDGDAIVRADDLWRTRIAPWCPETF